MDGSSKNVLVAGGGIGGITAALELASCGINVTMLESGPSIGGRMIQLDKTFPTLDCSTCTLSPKMVEVSLNHNIDLMTLAHITHVTRKGPGFLVGIKKNPRFVDAKKCTACGSCSEACVMKGRIPHEFNMMLGKRAAIYMPFPQAIPQKYLVDPEKCLFLSRGKCKKACLEACETGAIDFEDQGEELEKFFDGIVLAPGFDVYDPTEKKELGYGTLNGVVTGLEFERICSVTGPTGGDIQLGGIEPKRFYFIQCVGSRDRQSGARYCSRVCCMYTAKHASIVRDRIKDAQVFVSYIDVRAYGKGYDEFYKTTQENGALYIRGIPGEVVQGDGCLIVRVEDILTGEMREVEADIVVLATGVRPRKATEGLCEMMSVERDEYGFIKADAISPSQTNVEGIFVCGMGSGPKDVPDTVASGGEAASRCMEYIAKDIGS
ncbi:MAG: FAD-dependent oxidoreductase [Syntrophorhabdaceae bacterium]